MALTRQKQLDATTAVAVAIAAEQRKLDQEVEQLAIIGGLDAARRIAAERETANAIARIEARLDDLEAALAEDGPQVGDYATSPAASEEDVEQQLTVAIKNHYPIRFLYTKVDGTAAVRIISPYELKGPEDDYVLGWDHEREGLRQFALDRIEGVGVAFDATEYREPVE